jgi:hypothetical protein
MQLKKNIVLCLTLLFFTIPFALEAQRVRKEGEVEKEEKAPASFKSKLWYGGGIQLGFQSYLGYNVFGFGVSPMVGYKLTNHISAGPRVELNFTSIKQPGSKAESLFETDAGVFARVRIFRGLFLQGELSNQWYSDLDLYTGEKYSATRFNQRLGAGWNFGNGMGGGASEIGVFYNFAIANELNTYENPLAYRFGFTWNF